jgi:hypothetical protein
MVDRPETVVKGIVGVTDPAGGFHLLRSMPWAATWATETQSMLSVVGILSKISRIWVFRLRLQKSFVSSALRWKISREVHVGRSSFPDRQYISKVAGYDRKQST